MGGSGIDAIQYQAVEVRREVQGRAKSLDGRNRAAQPTTHTLVVAGATAQVCKQGAQEGAQYLARESCVPGTAVSQRIRQGEDPLACGDLREDSIDEVCGRVRHTSSSAGGTQAPSFTRESEQTVVAAGIAAQAQEPVGQDAAIEIGAQFALHEACDRRALFACAREEALEVLSNDFVEQCLLGLVALVLDGARPSRDRVLTGGQQVWCRIGVHSSSPLGEGAKTEFGAPNYASVPPSTRMSSPLM